MEVLHKIAAGEDPLKDIAVDASLDCRDSPNNLASPLISPAAMDTANPPQEEMETPNEEVNQDKAMTPQPKSLIYLLESYARIAIEERNHPKVIKKKKKKKKWKIMNDTKKIICKVKKKQNE